MISFALNLGNISNPAVSGAVPYVGTGAGYVGKIENIVSSIIGTLTIVAGAAMLLYLTYGGLRYVSAAGDEKAVAEARKTMTNAGIGLILTAASMIIATIILKVFGISLSALPWYK